MQKLDLGDTIAKYRKSLNLSQKELAEKLNVSSQLISKWETNNSIPNIEYIIELSKIFQVDINEFLKIETNKKTENNNSRKVNRIKKFLKENYKMLACVVGGFLFIITNCFLFSFLIINPILRNQNLDYLGNILIKYPAFNEDFGEEARFFNIQTRSFQNGELKEKYTFEGYVENGKSNFKRTYNSVVSFLIIDDVEYYNSSIRNYKKDFEEKDLIINAKDLFYHVYNETFNDEYNFEEKDLLQIKKRSYGFYFEIDSKKIQEHLRKSIKGIKVVGKVYGEIKFNKNQINSLSLNIKTYQKDIDETNEFKNEILFYYDKPNFKDEAPTNLLWMVEDTNCTNFLKSLELGEVVKIEEDEYNIDFSNEHFEFNNKLFIKKSNNINIYNSETLEFEKTINLPSTSPNEKIYQIDNYIVQILHDGIYKLDLNTEQIKTIYSFVGSCSWEKKDHIVFLSSYDRYGYSYYKINLTTESIENVSIDGKISFYYITNNYDLIYKRNDSLQKYNSLIHFPLSDCSFDEKDGFLYAYTLENDEYIYYKYNETELIETFTSATNIFENKTDDKVYIDKDKTKYFYLNGKTIYNSENVVIGTLKNIKTKNYYSEPGYSPEIIGIIEEKLIVKYKRGYFYSFGVCNINNLDKPISFFEANAFDGDIKFYKTDFFYIFCIGYGYSDELYYTIKLK